MKISPQERERRAKLVRTMKRVQEETGTHLQDLADLLQVRKDTLRGWYNDGSVPVGKAVDEIQYAVEVMKGRPKPVPIKPEPAPKPEPNGHAIDFKFCPHCGGRLK